MVLVFIEKCTLNFLADQFQSRHFSEDFCRHAKEQKSI